MNELTNNGETRWHKFGPVQVYARRDADGKPTKVDAIDEDEGQIRALAHRLQQVGYGVLREQVPRAGRVFYRLRGLWVGPGVPPEGPLEPT